MAKVVAENWHGGVLLLNCFYRQFEGYEEVVSCEEDDDKRNSKSGVGKPHDSYGEADWLVSRAESDMSCGSAYSISCIGYSVGSTLPGL